VEFGCTIKGITRKQITVMIRKSCWDIKCSQVCTGQPEEQLDSDHTTTFQKIKNKEKSKEQNKNSRNVR
jgi:hypothetical protein